MPTGFQRRARRKRMLAEEFERSGMTRISFCHRKKIPLSTLDWWLRKIRTEAPRPAPCAKGRSLFIPLAMPQEHSADQGRFELYFPDGRKLLLPAGIAIDDVIRIMSVPALS